MSHKENKLRNILRALAILAGVTILFSPFAVSTPEIAKKEQKQCQVCHTAMGKPDLNDAGKYYKEKRTLDGYQGRP